MRVGRAIKKNRFKYITLICIPVAVTATINRHPITILNITAPNTSMLGELCYLKIGHKSRRCAQINLNNKNKSYNRSDYRFDDASRGAITING